MRFTDRDLHIVPGLSSGGSLHRLGIAWSSMCVAEDDLSRGPLMSLDDPEEFRKLRRHYWRREDDVDTQDSGIPFIPSDALHTAPNRVRSAERVFLWLGTTLQEQIALAWFVTAFKHLGIATGALRLLDLKAPPPHCERSIRALNCENIRKMARWRRPAKRELASYEAAWRAVSSPSPEGLIAFCGSAVQHPAPLEAALDAFMARYPAVDTGLTYWDRILLANCRAHGPRTARIIGHTMVHDRQYPDWPGDLYLFDRLRRLGDPRLVRPLLALTGDLSAIRFVEAAITETGERVLAGEANHVALNGIDDRVGGVRLDARAGSPWVFDGKTLVPGGAA